MIDLRSSLCLLALATSLPAHGRDFQTSDVNPPGSPTVETVAHFGELLRQRSGGRFRIQVLGAADQDSENFTIRQVQAGTLDLARVNLSAFNSTVPATLPLSMPFLFKSASHLRRILDGPIGAEILASLETQEVIGLCFYDTGSRAIYSINRPVRYPTDLDGLKVRVQPGDLAGRVLKVLGATPVALPYSRIGDALRTQAIDAAAGNWPAYVLDGHYRHAKVYNDTQHSWAPGVLIISKAVWRELSAADQAMLKQAALETVAFMRQTFDAFEARVRAQVIREGVRAIDDIDEKSFTDILVPLYPGWLPTQRQRDVVARIQADARPGERR